MVSRKFLIENPDNIFVFGDNTLRRGRKGAAFVRDLSNSYGFITKKFPSYDNDAYYKPKQYKIIFEKEIKKLTREIEHNSDKIFLITKLGSGLANKYKIYEKVIQPGLEVLKKYKNVKFI